MESAPAENPDSSKAGAAAEEGTPGLNRGEPTAPAAYIAQLQIDGEVVGDYADLTARVRVEITREDGWHEVPLGLDQARIYESSYEDGPGAAAPMVGGDDAEGLRWLFRGVGTHRLLLKFRLPISAVAAGRQLQLSLPPLPANYVTRAVLRVPEAHVVAAEPLSNATLHQRMLETGVTELSCDVEGARWELSWRTAVDAAPRLARVVTGLRVRADREARLLRLTARQQCTVEQGRLGEVQARLPTGFELESVELRGAAPQLLTTAEAAGRPGWVRVLLGDAAQGVFELEWRLTRVFPAGGGSIVVDGLELEGARWQGGTIEVESVEGYGVRYQAAESVALQRVDVAERRPGDPAFDFRFEFQRQPFVLAYELSPVAARTDAVADAYLSLSAGSHDLYLDVRLEVLSGQVHEIAIDWPGFAAGGWRAGFSRAYVTVESGGGVEEVVDGTLDQDALSADPDRLRLQLSRPCGGSLRALLHFARVAALPSGALELSLPRPTATFVRAPSLTVASAVNLEARVTAEGAELPRVPREGSLPPGVPLQFGGEGARVYALSPDPGPVNVTWEERRRTISAETTVTVELLKPGALRVVQDIAYDVMYGYVSTLLLEAPAEWRSGAEATGTGSGSGLRVVLDGQELPAEARDGHWRVEPPDPRRGRFQLTIEHVVPAPAGTGGAARTVTIPILQAVDAPFGSTTVHLPVARKLRLSDSETGWHSWLTRSGDGAWQSATPRQGVQLVIDETLRNAPQQFTVDTAFVRTWFGDPGQVSVYAEYAVREAPASMVLTLPEASSSVECLWNGAVAEVRAGVDAGPGERVIALPVGEQETIDGRLSVRYRLRRPDRSTLVSTCAVEFPRFGDKVEVDTTYWEVVLPPGEHLSTPPAGFVPQYTWERESLLWARRPTAEYRAVRERVAVHEREVAGAAPRGNVYAYSAVGAVPRGACRAMALSLIVLIGAGVSLLLGFVFRRVPATRNLLSILVLGFACALGALWQLELIQLLLQPALLGLSLAAIAVWFDSGRHAGRGRRSQTSLSGGKSADRRSTAVPLSPAIPARTAVFQSEAASESGRPG